MIPLSRSKFLGYSLYGALLFCLTLNSISWWLLTTFPVSLHRRLILPRTPYIDNKSENYFSLASQTILNNKKNETLPEWITSYLQWHKETVKSLSADNWQDSQYLVARCHSQDVPCGGLADRLRALPFLVQVAAMTGRVLFLSWERPYDLGAFLEPTDEGVDWRLPEFVPVPRESVVFTHVHDVSRIQTSTETIVSVRFQAYKEAEKFFDRYKVQPNDADMTAVLAPLWHLFFRPAPPVQEQIDSFYQLHNLTTAASSDDPYLATHLRVWYDREPPSSQHVLVEQVRNALACTSQFATFSSHTSIVVTSDSRQVLAIAQQLAPRQVVVTTSIFNDSSYPTLHLDRGSRFLEKPNDNDNDEEESSDVPSYPVEAYYSTFVDLYLLMGAQCVAIDRGGFGRLASLLSTNTSCRINHRHEQC